MTWAMLDSLFEYSSQPVERERERRLLDGLFFCRMMLVARIEFMCAIIVQLANCKRQRGEKERSGKLARDLLGGSVLLSFLSNAAK